ncbi:MAG: argininosuccinate lyase [Alphaproteobacteria bacterium]|nr:argininosuccinate lyase [Alphaproteobacteria bacterium]
MSTSVPAESGLLTEARLASGPAEVFVRIAQGPGLRHEMDHFDAFLAVDLAHTVMLVERSILTGAQGAAILGVLRDIRARGRGGLDADPQRGSFLLQVEAELARRLGEDVGGRMHTGRSRIDQGATVRRLHTRCGVLPAMARLLGLRAAVLALAGRHRRTLMPGYTHMQHAQPWILGHYLHSMAVRLDEDFHRLVESYARLNLSPLGAVGLAGTSWPIDRDRTAALLGFSGLVENSRLAREAWYAADVVAALSFVMATLNDIATDFHVWSSWEFGLVETDDAFCGTSSIFPQKKNPSALEAIKKESGAATQWLAQAMTTFRGEGSGDQAIRELSMLDDAVASTDGMLELATALVDTLIVHEARMREVASGNWSTASNLADALVRDAGLSYRQSHHVVARLVRLCLQRKLPPQRAGAAELDEAGRQTIGRALGLSDAAVQEALDADAFVRTRVTRGSLAPAEIDRMLAEAAAELEADRGWLRAEEARIAAAAKALDEAVDRVIAS